MTDEYDGHNTGFAVFLPGNYRTSDFLSSYSNLFLFVGERLRDWLEGNRTNLTIPSLKSFTTAGGGYQTFQLPALEKSNYPVNLKLHEATAREIARLSLGTSSFPKHLLSLEYIRRGTHTGEGKVVRLVSISCLFFGL